MNEIEKKFTEQTTDICKLLDKMICGFKGEVDADIKNLDTDEAYKAADIIKDLSEAYKNISKAIYYCTVSSAMEEYGEMPDESEMKYYTPMRDSKGRYMRRRYHDMGMADKTMYDDPRYYDMARDMDRNAGRMYYSEPMHDMSYKHDMRDGHNWNSRRTYMDNPSRENLEKHVDDITTDIKDLMVNMTPDNKMMVKSKLISLANAM